MFHIAHGARQAKEPIGDVGVTMHVQPKLPEGGKARRIYLLLREEISNGVFWSERFYRAKTGWPKRLV